VSLFIAFLRAINVGGRTVTMNRLRAHFEALRLTGVATFIASGNVIFESADADAGALERRIETGLARALGYEVDTFLRTPAEVAAVASGAPLAVPEDGVSRLFVGFLREHPPAPAKKRALALRSDTDELRVEGREVYWLCRASMAESPVSGSAIEKALGMRTTLRNINTVRRLAARYAPAE
jgi:uncharacterized protein (DUF1697 family)